MVRKLEFTGLHVRWATAIAFGLGCGPGVQLDGGGSSGSHGSGSDSQPESTTGVGTSTTATTGLDQSGPASSDGTGEDTGPTPGACLREATGTRLGSLLWSTIELPEIYGVDVAWSPAALFTVGGSQIRSYSHAGELLWTTSWDAPRAYQSAVSRIVALPDGALATVWVSDRRWVVAFEPDGSERWRRDLGDTLVVQIFSRPSGAVLVAGSSLMGPSSGFDQRLLELDAQGQVLDDRRFDLELDYPYGAAQAVDMNDAGEIVMGGTVGYGVDIGWLARFDQDREFIGFENLGAATYVAVALTPESDVVVFAGESGGRKQLWRGDIDGVRSWERDVNQVYASDFDVDCDGRIYLAFGGVTTYGPDGTVLWSTTDDVVIDALVLDPDGRMFTVGGVGTELALQLAEIAAH